MSVLVVLADGSAPYIAAVRAFYAYAPEKIEYALDRFAMEVKRLLDVLNRHLSERRICVETSTRLRHGELCWYGALVAHNIYEAAEFSTSVRTRMCSVGEGLEARPAVPRGDV